MPPMWIFTVVWVISAIGSLLIGAALITYIRRTWQQIRLDSDGSTHDRILDALDQVQIQLYSMSERLEGLERRLGPGEEAEGGDAGDSPDSTT